MTEYVYDHRLVQTAVIGHRESDHPVILPMDAHELDVWRKLHPTYSYWCGLELGGCGGELSDKRYTEKVCHFAHHPSAPVCRRTSNGESSADHLFIKQGVRRLLDARKLRGTVQTLNLGTGPGDAIDVRLPDGRRALRFQLSPLDYRAWRHAADELSAEADGVDWIFSTDGPITQELVSRHGYCLRVRCETVGGERKVHIGAEARDRSVAWTPLEECTLTPSGIVTPQVEQIRLAQPRPKPLAFPVQGALSFALVPGSKPPAGSPFAAADRHLLVADVKPVGSPVVRALISLPGDTEPPPAEHVYQALDSARILVTEHGQGWAVEVKRFARLNAHEAQGTGLWTPPARIEPEPTARVAEPVRKTKPAGPVVRKAPPATVVEPESEKKTPTASPQPLSHFELVSGVRDVLIRHARMRSTATWGTLDRAVSPQLGVLSRADRENLLVEVDTPLREDHPVLSALIRYEGDPLPYLANVLDRLGVPYAYMSSQIKRWAEVEAERAFAAYGTPAQAMPQRLSLRPGRPAKALTKKKPKQTAGAIRKDPDVERVRSLSAELDRLWPWLSGQTRREIIGPLDEARSWLSFRDGARTSRRQIQRAASQSGAQHVGALQRVLAVANHDVKTSQLLERPQNKARQPAAASHTAPSVSAPPKAPRVTPVESLTRQLIGVASRGGTIALLDMEDGRSFSDFVLQQRLRGVDAKVTAEVPLLSALVTGADGGPVPFFRALLHELGFEVPQTDEVLLKIWRREQERAYAAYANPPRPLPPRQVPVARRDGEG